MKEKKTFIFGNYPSYYSYRNDDDRLPNIDSELRRIGLNGLTSLIAEKRCLDIGCNTGKVTMEIAEKYRPKWILGMDIDNKLISIARKLIEEKSESVKGSGLPSNIRFSCDNIVREDIKPRQMYDMVICMSVTKWIHLNYGDDGIRRLFSNILALLKPNGHLLLEPQSFKTYSRRKKLSPDIEENYKSINFKPEAFKEFIVSLGFELILQIGSLEESKGFERCIFLFKKCQ